jgi:tetratricopeptide (TPR) repeat protein
MSIDPDTRTVATGDLDPTIAPPAARSIGPHGSTTSPQTDPEVLSDPADAAAAGAPARGDADGTIVSVDDPELTHLPKPSTYTAGAPLVPGTKLGPRYTVLKLLGRGGMGAVYQAYDDELGVAVAIKTILHDAGSDAYTRQDQVSRFKSELLLARQVSHKNVVRIHDIGEVEGLKYITMSYVAGETLAALVRRVGPLPVPQALALARQIAEGMAAAHEVGVVHRDLKPDNVMVTRDGQALIMDFGIAHSPDTSPRHPERGMVGTIPYMAPEQTRAGVVDARADIYAFGLMVYDMLLGPQRRKAFTDPMEELRSRLNAAPPPVRAVRADVPEAFEAVIARATRPKPSDRYADTQELRAALAALTDTGHLRPVERPRAQWPAAVASVAVTLLAATGAWWWFAPRPEVQHAPVSVLVADFENRTGDPVFDGVVEQALGLGIEGASFVTVFPRRDGLRVAAAIKPGATLDEQTARLVALREGLSLVLAGSVERSGSGYRISARALQGGDEAAAPLHTLSIDAADRNAVLDGVGRLAGDLREALGDTEVPSGNPMANESFTAATLEAAHAYASAQELQWAGKVEEAIGQYRQAIALDPDMGRAYAGLAAQYANLGRTDEAETTYQEALARIDRMTDREKFRTRGSYYLFARKPDLATQEFTSLVKAFPADSSGLGNLALAAFYKRDMAQALDQGRKAAELFSKNVLRRSNVALYAMYAGQFDQAIAEADLVHQLNPRHVKAFVARALSHLALDRVPDALATYDALAGVGAAGESFAAAGRADVAHYEGRLADAAALLNAGIVADAAQGNMSAASSKRIALAEVRLAQNDLAAAAREADAAAQSGESDVIRAGAGLVLAAAGRTNQAELLAGSLATRLEADPQAYARLVLAEVALQRKDARRAIEYAREAQKLSDTWLGRTLLGRAYLAARAFPEAYSELEAALKRRGEATSIYLDDVPTYRHLAPVHYAMGLAQEGLRSPAAAASFKTYLAIKARGEEVGFVADARERAGS